MVQLSTGSRFSKNYCYSEVLIHMLWWYFFESGSISLVIISITLAFLVYQLSHFKKYCSCDNWLIIILIELQKKKLEVTFSLNKFIYFHQKPLPSMLWHCWFSIRKSIQPVTIWVLSCWHGYLSGVGYKWFAYALHMV